MNTSDEEFVLVKKRGRIPYEKVGEVRAAFDSIFLQQQSSAGEDEIAIADLPTFIAALGLNVPPDEVIKMLCKEMEPTARSAMVSFRTLVDWYPTLEQLSTHPETVVVAKSVLAQKTFLRASRPRPGVDGDKKKKVATSRACGIDWARINGMLPFKRTEVDKQRRSKMFDQFDPNGNGYLSLAEVDKGLRDIGLHEVFDCKPVIMRAFQAAKNAHKHSKSKPSKYGADYVEKSEFRLLLYYLRQYFELWQMFAITDTSEDRRIDAEEFAEIFPRLPAWGVDTAGSTPEELFAEIDVNGGGIILFDEFAAWALEKGLDLEGDDDDDE